MVSMALFMNQENTRTELQRRVAADLAEKAKKKATSEAAPVDGVEDSAYLKGTKRTTSLAWVWVLILIAIVALLIWIAVRSS